MADVKADEVSPKPEKRQEYRAPTLRTYGNIEALTQGSKDGATKDSSGKGRTGGLP